MRLSSQAELFIDTLIVCMSLFSSFRNDWTLLRPSCHPTSTCCCARQTTNPCSSIRPGKDRRKTSRNTKKPCVNSKRPWSNAGDSERGRKKSERKLVCVESSKGRIPKRGRLRLAAEEAFVGSVVEVEQRGELAQLHREDDRLLPLLHQERWLAVEVPWDSRAESYRQALEQVGQVYEA